MSDRQQVIPGEVITNQPLRLESNVQLYGNDIISTITGFSEIADNGVRVLPLTGKYIPNTDDLVVGKVVSHTSLSWEVDINSCYAGILPAQDVFGRDYSAHADELNAKLAKGNLIAARIVNFDRTRDPLITVADRDLGKIDSGLLVPITPGKVPKLIGRSGSMIQLIEDITKSILTVGQNGWIVVGNDDSVGLLKAVKAVEMVNREAHIANLTDKVEKMLKSSD